MAMRKVVSWLFVSLDGVAEAPGEWQLPEYFDQDLLAALEAQTAAEDAMLLGRVTYQEWEPYWPTSTDEPYASHINNIPKYVVSTNLDDVEWGKWKKPTMIRDELVMEINKLNKQSGKNIQLGGKWKKTTLIRDEFVMEINKLKQQSGKNISVGGSPTLVGSLLQEDLLDELKLMIHPVVVGKGKRLFTEDVDLKRMRLVDSKVT